MAADPPTTEDGAPTALYGVAALSLLEAIILILQEKALIDEAEIDEAFSAAIDSHLCRQEEHSGEHNEVVARLLERLRVHGNSVRLDLNDGQ